MHHKLDICQEHPTESIAVNIIAENVYMNRRQPHYMCELSQQGNVQDVPGPRSYRNSGRSSHSLFKPGRQHYPTTDPLSFQNWGQCVAQLLTTMSHLIIITVVIIRKSTARFLHVINFTV